MRTQLRSLLLLGMFILAVQLGELIAQAEDRTPPVEVTSEQFGADPSSGLATTSNLRRGSFTIDFEGGTITEYVELLRSIPSISNLNKESQIEPVNIVVTASAKDFVLPPIKVRTNMAGALGLLPECSDMFNSIDVITDESNSIKLIQINSNEPHQVTVINCMALLEKMPVKDLMEVIDAGLKMQGSPSMVELKLHEGTGLMFAKGSVSGTKLVYDIVNELSGE